MESGGGNFLKACIIVVIILLALVTITVCIFLLPNGDISDGVTPDDDTSDTTPGGNTGGNTGGGSTEDGGNVDVEVTTGDIKVDIVDLSGISVIGRQLKFINAPVGDKMYFAPGATYVTEGFKVKNIGDLTFNFRMNISKGVSTTGTNFNEGFDIYITTDPVNYADAQRITEHRGTLDVDNTSETFYLVISMKESAGNEFENKTYTGIGVTVYATQPQ